MTLPVESLAVEPASARLAERQLGALATVRLDGTTHVVPVGFTYDAERRLVRIICSDASQKVRNVERTGQASVTQIDGRFWLTLDGPARIERSAAAVADAEQRYAQRYGQPRPNPQRVVIEITVTRALGRL